MRYNGDNIRTWPTINRPIVREVSFMDFNKIKEMGLEYAEKGKNAATGTGRKGQDSGFDRK